MRHISRDPESWERDRELLDPRNSGPDSLIGVTEGGRTIFWLVLVMVIAAVLVIGFIRASAG
jgi:hypothetical protein